MDPVSAVGLASSIITFIDFGLKIVAGSVKIYNSATGASAEHAQLEETLDRLDALYADLSKPPATSAAAAASSNEQKLVKIAGACASTAKELRAALEGVVARPHSVRSAVAKSIKMSFDTKIRKYKERLGELNGEYQQCMSAVLLDRQSSMSQFLDKLSDEHRKLGLDRQHEVDIMHGKLFSLVEKNQQSTESQIHRVQDLCQAMQQTLVKGQQLDTYHRLLETLHFDGMRSRRTNIRSASQGTYVWIYQSQHAGQDIGFTKWLLDGSRFFWINGKPGSGKSTLMKYIAENEQTLNCLKTWAGDRTLISGSFYFWSAGNKLEQSLEGLLRSMIFEILQQCPELMPLVGRYRAQHLNSAMSRLHLQEIHWSQDELMQVLKAFASADAAQRRFCFFIDGMDECEAGDLETSEVLSTIATWANFKLCLSSRPHNVFEAHFTDDRDLTLTLHQHTRKDIRRYAAGILGLTGLLDDRDLSEGSALYESSSENVVESKTSRQGENSIGLQSYTQIEKQTLLGTIETGAEGVFLWVFLVIKRLQNSIHNGDTFEEALRLLQSFPNSLSGVFTNILDSIDGNYWQSSSQILLMCMANPSGRSSLLAFQHVTPLPQVLTESSIERWNEESTKRIKARCADFLEVVNYQVALIKIPEVQFAHRSMIEYLSEPEVSSKIWSRLNTGFDPSLQICKNLTQRLPEILSSDSHLGSDIPHHIWFVANASKNPCRESVYAMIDEARALIEAARSCADTIHVESMMIMPLRFCGEEARAYLEHVLKHDAGFPKRTLIYRNYHREKPLKLVQASSEVHSKSHEALDLLLKHGADPNGPLESTSGTVWSTYFDISYDIGSNISPIFDFEQSSKNAGTREFSKQFTMMICSMINAGADLDCKFIYKADLDATPHDWTLDALLDDLVEDTVLQPDHVEQIKHLARIKRQDNARTELSRRAQWSGWE